MVPDDIGMRKIGENINRAEIIRGSSFGMFVAHLCDESNTREAFGASFVDSARAE